MSEFGRDPLRTRFHGEVFFGAAQADITRGGIRACGGTNAANRIIVPVSDD